MLSSRTSRVETAVIPRLPLAPVLARSSLRTSLAIVFGKSCGDLVAGLGAKSGQHIVAQRLGLERDGVRTVAGDLAGEAVEHADVDGDLLTFTPAEGPGADDGGAAAKRGGSTVGDPDSSLAGARPLAYGVVDDLAQVDPLRTLHRSGWA